MAKNNAQKVKDEKKNLGKDKKDERAKVAQILLQHKGKSIDALTNKQKDDLLTVMIVVLGLADKTGVIK